MAEGSRRHKETADVGGAFRPAKGEGGICNLTCLEQSITWNRIRSREAKEDSVHHSRDGK